MRMLAIHVGASNDTAAARYLQHIRSSWPVYVPAASVYMPSVDSAEISGNSVLRVPTACITFPVVNTISLKLPNRLLERLEAESRARGTTKSSLVRKGLEKLLDARPAGEQATRYDLASDLAGSLKGLPRDLATNPRYLEGFGQ